MVLIIASFDLKEVDKFRGMNEYVLQFYEEKTKKLTLQYFIIVLAAKMGSFSPPTMNNFMSM
jgi:hypothetical protein